MSTPRRCPDPRRRPSAGVGLAILSALAQGCAARPAPQPAPAQPAPSLPPLPGASPAIVQAVVRAHEQRRPAPADGRTFRGITYWENTDTAALVYTRFWLPGSSEPACFFGPPKARSCGLLSVLPHGQRASEPVALDRDWHLLAPVREGVFASSAGEPPLLGWISPAGAVTELGSLRAVPGAPHFTHLSAVDLGARAFLLVQASDLFLVEAQRSPAPRVTPHKGLAIQGAQTAQDARRAEAAGRRVLYGEPVLVALASADAWAMVWIEAFAPPYGPPPPLRGGLEKNRCGSHSPSRSLGDPSVEKRLLVTRFKATEIVGEETVERSREIDLEQQHIEASAEGDRVRASMAPGGWQPHARLF